MRGLSGGVFDGIHPGHEFFLREAKKLVDELVVVIAADRTAEKLKGRLPKNSQGQRLEAVNALKLADKVIPGGDSEFGTAIENEKPDVVLLGYDQDIERIIPGFSSRFPAIKIRRIGKLGGYSSSALSGGG